MAMVVIYYQQKETGWAWPTYEEEEMEREVDLGGGHFGFDGRRMVATMGDGFGIASEAIVTSLTLGWKTRNPVGPPVCEVEVTLLSTGQPRLMKDFVPPKGIEDMSVQDLLDELERRVAQR